MADRLYYCVVEDYKGEISVASFLGKNKAEERKFALNGYRTCHLVTEDHDAAQSKAASLRRVPPIAR